MPRRNSELYLLPAMNDSGARVFKPPEGLSERPFDFAFNSIDFIASNPFLPLQFRIIETPALWNSPICRLALLELGLVLVLGFSWVGWGCIGSTVAPEILHIVAVAAVDVNPRWSSGSHPRISLNLLHPSITIGFGSEIIHTWYSFFWVFETFSLMNDDDDDAAAAASNSSILFSLLSFYRNSLKCEEFCDCDCACACACDFEEFSAFLYRFFLKFCVTRWGAD